MLLETRAREAMVMKRKIQGMTMSSMRTLVMGGPSPSWVEGTRAVIRNGSGRSSPPR